MGLITIIFSLYFIMRAVPVQVQLQLNINNFNAICWVDDIAWRGLIHPCIMMTS